MTSNRERVPVIRPGLTYVGRQGFTYGQGASMETVGAERICMNVLPMPAGARAKVHTNDRIETIAYLLEGDQNGIILMPELDALLVPSPAVS